MKYTIVLLIITISISITYAQVGINIDGSAPHSSALLDVKSTTKAFYPPRMTTAQKNAIANKQVGAVVFDITLNQLSFYNGTAWVAASGFTLPYTDTIALPIFTNGNILDITHQGGSEGSAIVGRTNTAISGAGIFGVANANLTDVAGVRGWSTSTNDKGIGVHAIHSGTGPAFSGITTNGIGAKLTSTNGFALQTQGKLQFAGNGVGVLGANKFLKSINASGDAQWADLIPIIETKNLDNTLISITNTLTTTNSPTIEASSNSVSNGEAINAKVVNIAPTGYTVAIRATNESTNSLGAGLYGAHRGSGAGVFGNSFSGIGVYGDGSTGVKGEGGYGIHGIGYIYGVFGEKSGTTGSAVYGAGGLRGVYGQSEAYGVYGVSNYLDPPLLKYAGVYGESNSNNDKGSGVYGTHNGQGPGVRGFSVYGIGGSFNSDLGYALITQGGNVGIGTDTPAAKMDIKGTSYLSHFFYGANEDTYIRGGKAGGKVIINDIAGLGNVGIGTVNPNGQLQLSNLLTNRKLVLYEKMNNDHEFVGFGVNGNTLRYQVDGIVANHVFYAGFNNGSPNSVDLMRIQGNGKVGIGVSNADYILDVNDRMRLRSNGSNTAGIYFNYADNSTWTSFYGMKTDNQAGIFIGGTWRFWVDNTGAGFLNGNLIQTSDRRLKKDFIQLNNSLTDIYKLNGYNFRWIEEVRNKDLQTGLIAQEVQKIFPELVQTDEKGFLSVNYIGLIPHLIEAIKELKNENTNLKENQKSVENRLQKLEEILTAYAKK